MVLVGLLLRARLERPDLDALAAADALISLSGHRRQQVWDAAAQQRAPALLQGAPVHEEALALPAAPEGEEIVFDYAAMGLTLRRHPLALLRPLSRMMPAALKPVHVSTVARAAIAAAKDEGASVLSASDIFARGAA